MTFLLLALRARLRGGFELEGRGSFGSLHIDTRHVESWVESLESGGREEEKEKEKGTGVFQSAALVGFRRVQVQVQGPRSRCRP